MAKDSLTLAQRLQVLVPVVPTPMLDDESLDEAGRAITDASDTHLPGAISSTVQYFKSPLYLAWSPSRPLSRGYLQYLGDLSENSRFTLGRPAGDGIIPRAAGLEIEAVISTQTANLEHQQGNRPVSREIVLAGCRK